MDWIISKLSCSLSFLDSIFVVFLLIMVISLCVPPILLFSSMIFKSTISQPFPPSCIDCSIFINRRNRARTVHRFTSLLKAYRTNRQHPTTQALFRQSCLKPLLSHVIINDFTVIIQIPQSVFRLKIPCRAFINITIIVNDYVVIKISITRCKAIAIIRIDI